MIAIPLDSQHYETATISDYFGAVAYFALFDARGHWKATIANEGKGSGEQMSDFLAAAGVTEVAFRHLGDKLFGWLSRRGIRAYAVTDPDLSVVESVRALRERRLEAVSDATLGRLLHPAGPGNGEHCPN